MGRPLGFEALAQSRPRSRPPPPTTGVAGLVAQCGPPARLKALHVSPDGALGTTESPRHLILVGPPLFDQRDPGKGFGHAIPHRLLRQGQSGHDDHPMALLRSEQTAIVDELRASGQAGVWEPIIGFGRDHRPQATAAVPKKRTGLGSRSPARRRLSIQRRIDRRTAGLVRGSRKFS